MEDDLAPAAESWIDALPKSQIEILKKNKSAIATILLATMWEYVADFFMVGALSDEESAAAVGLYYSYFVFIVVTISSLMLGAISDIGRVKGAIKKEIVKQTPDSELPTLTVSFLSVMFSALPLMLIAMPFFYCADSILGGKADRSDKILAAEILKKTFDTAGVLAYLVKWAATMSLYAYEYDWSLANSNLARYATYVIFVLLGMI